MTYQTSARFVICAGLAAVLVAGLQAPAVWAGACCQAGEKLGVQPLRPNEANAAPGTTVEVVVLNPAKLAGYGLAGVQANDRVFVTIGQNGNFNVRLARTGQVRHVVLSDGSARAPAAQPLNAGPANKPQAPVAGQKKLAR